MKLFYFLLVLTLTYSSTLNAKVIKDLKCFTPDHLTTSFSLHKVKSGDFELTLNHHNGVEFAPIHKGIITSYDIKHLVNKSEVFKGLGANYKIIFKSGECNFRENYLSCSSNKKMKVNDLNVKSFSFSLVKESVETVFSKYDSWLAHIDVARKGDNFVYNSVTRYALGHCFFSEND